MLYDYLKNFTLEDALKIESQDRQFLALKKLYENKKFSDELYLFLIIANALISFQLSWKGEDYWEEFGDLGIRGDFGDEKKIKKEKICEFFENLLRNGKNNRRFVDMKLKRIQKIVWYQENVKKISDDDLRWYQNDSLKRSDLINLWLDWWELYYKNMDKLAQDLGEIMGQAKDAKTIVFAVKMFSYWARNVFGYVEKFPFTLNIPIDSRLVKLYLIETRWEARRGQMNKKDVKNFYQGLAKKLNIPPLHLDAILWVNFAKIEKMLNVRDV